MLGTLPFIFLSFLLFLDGLLLHEVRFLSNPFLFSKNIRFLTSSSFLRTYYISYTNTSTSNVCRQCCYWPQHTKLCGTEARANELPSRSKEVKLRRKSFYRRPCRSAHSTEMAVKLRRVESRNDAIRIFNFTDRHKARSNVTRLQTASSNWMLV